MLEPGAYRVTWGAERLPLGDTNEGTQAALKSADPEDFGSDRLEPCKVNRGGHGPHHPSKTNTAAQGSVRDGADNRETSTHFGI
jgi:hypothetical protein